MLRKTFAFGMMLILAGLVFAQGAKKTVQIHGHVIDNMCAPKDAASMDKAKGHPASCALKPKCAESGLSVVADGKVYKLDEAGTKSAMEILKNTKSQKGVHVKVEGTVEGDKLTVKNISEIPAAS